MAEKLGLDDAAGLLGETLAEEEEADTKLTEVAEGLYEHVATRDEPDEAAEDEAVAVASVASSRNSAPKKKAASSKR